MEERGEDGNGDERKEGRGEKVGGGEGKERGGQGQGEGREGTGGNRDTVLAVSHAVTRTIDSLRIILYENISSEIS